MVRTPLIVGAAALLLSLAPSLIAHDNFRVVGTIAKRQEKTKIQDLLIDVAVDNWATVKEIHVDAGTEITRDKKPVDPKELKVGVYVVVDAWGDNYESLQALQIRIVPPIAPAK